ncbi:MAG: isochorismate synthase [bacterium]
MRSSLIQAAEENLPFAVYSLPEDEEVQVIIQKDRELPFFPFEDISELEGFIVAPFRGDRINHALCVRADNKFRMNVNEFSDQVSGILTDQLVDMKRTGEYVMTKEEYLKRVAYLVELLRDGELRKVVVSRIVDHKIDETFSIWPFLVALIQGNPKAFVYLVRLPGFGTWIGATPELLFRMEGARVETVALAGTMPADETTWKEKEIREQRIVMDYIEELLFREKITTYEKEGPITASAGNVQHLKTTYSLSREQTEKKVGKLIAGLHPTPAVCGLPRNKAYELIRKVEKHERGFYSGFIGPWHLNDASQLYVNLRCAEILNDRINLFVGGGLTAESKPVDEWEETVRKSYTLLSVLEKI